MKIWDAINFASIPLTWGSQLLSYKLNVLGKGKILTEPMVRMAVRRANILIRKGELLGALRWLRFAAYPRWHQTWPLYLLAFPTVPLSFTTDIFGYPVICIVWCSIFWWPTSALHLDDVLTGKDRKWRKKFAALKNRIKWRWLPARQPVLVPTR